MTRKSTISRRAFLSGQGPASHHISSAVVIALPARADALAVELAALSGVEVHAREGSRIVITIEGPTTGALGETLARITLFQGVLAANMVFEQALQPEVSET